MPDKSCTSCGRIKDFNEFRKQAGKKYGLRYECIDCQDAKARARYEKNKEKIKEQARAYKERKRNES